MSKTRRSFSASEKLSIINEADQYGVSVTLRKHNLSPTAFRRWKESFIEGGVSRLQSYSKQGKSLLPNDAGSYQEELKRVQGAFKNFNQITQLGIYGPS